MKRKNSKTTSILCLVLAIIMLFSSVVMASDNNRRNDSADYLAKLNYGLDPEDWVTDLPREPSVEIPDDFTPDDSPLEHYYPENMTDTEIDEVIQRIANGENVIFGDGVPMDYSVELSERSSEPLRWKAGKNKTHQWITTRAFIILAHDKPSVYNWFMTSERTAATEYSDWPDDNETSNFNDWHFYHSPSGTNYYRNTKSTNTAKSRFAYWYNQAVSAGRNSNWVTAAQHLGKSIHYLSDIGAPPHVGDRASYVLGAYVFDPIQGLDHLSYESDAESRRTQYAVSTSVYYNWYLYCTPSEVATTNAFGTYTYYDDAYNGTTSARNAAIEWPLKYAQMDVAGLLYKYYYDVTGRTS